MGVRFFNPLASVACLRCCHPVECLFGRLKKKKKKIKKNGENSKSFENLEHIKIPIKIYISVVYHFLFSFGKLNDRSRMYTRGFSPFFILKKVTRIDGWMDTR